MTAKCPRSNTASIMVCILAGSSKSATELNDNPSDVAVSSECDLSCFSKNAWVFEILSKNVPASDINKIRLININIFDLKLIAKPFISLNVGYLTWLVCIRWSIWLHWCIEPSSPFSCKRWDELSILLPLKL